MLQEGFVPLFTDPQHPDAPDSYLDLDTGRRYSKEEADIQFAVSQGTMTFYYLQPLNGAAAIVVGEVMPGFHGCQERISDALPGNIPDMLEGTYICLRTDRGHLAQLRIDEISHLGEGSIQVSFITWSSTD